MSDYRDRIKELRMVRAGDLVPHPLNWRLHTEQQRTFMSMLLTRIGYTGALMGRDMADGTVQLIDGHLRAELTSDSMVPVIIVELSDQETLEVLATLDPLSTLADYDQEAINALVEGLEEGITMMVEDMGLEAAEEQALEMADVQIDEDLEDELEDLLERQQEGEELVQTLNTIDEVVEEGPPVIRYRCPHCGGEFDHAE